MTVFECIKKMNIDTMAKYFALDAVPGLPHSACYICPFDKGMTCGKDGCSLEYKTSLYKQYLERKCDT